MKTSKDRILTTHAGSLPRTDKLAKLLIERDNDLPVDEAEMRREVERATDWLVTPSSLRAVSISAVTARRPASDSRPMSASACPADGAVCRHAKA